MAPQTKLQGTRITRKGGWRKQCAPGQPSHQLKHALQLFTGASEEGWGAHLNDHTAKGTHKLPGTKSGPFGPK